MGKLLISRQYPPVSASSPPSTAEAEALSATLTSGILPPLVPDRPKVDETSTSMLQPGLSVSPPPSFLPSLTQYVKLNLPSLRCS